MIVPFLLLDNGDVFIKKTGDAKFTFVIENSFEDDVERNFVTPTIIAMISEDLFHFLGTIGLCQIRFFAII